MDEPAAVDTTPQPQSHDELRPPMSTWDNAFSSLQQRVASLIESIESQSKASAGPDNVEPEPEDDPLDQADSALQARRQADRAELPLLMERLKAKIDAPSNLSGIVASLPEITAEHRQALSRFDQRLELMKVRTDATADALAGIVREIEHLGTTVDDIGRTVSNCQNTEAELASNQRQMAESLNVLHGLVARATETVKSNAAWVEMIASAPDNQFQSLRDQVIAQSARMETRSNVTLIASAVAALASIVALVISLIHGR